MTYEDSNRRKISFSFSFKTEMYYFSFFLSFFFFFFFSPLIFYIGTQFGVSIPPKLELKSGVMNMDYTANYKAQGWP